MSSVLLETRAISINGIYEDGNTFSKLLIKAIYEELTAYGFECETNGTYSNMYVSWNGSRRFYFSSISNTTKIGLRIAVPYGSSNWGSTILFDSVNSTSTATQSFSYTIEFFAVGDYAYFKLSSIDDGIYSFPITSLDGTITSVVGIRKFENSASSNWTIVPLCETTMSNSTPWYIAQNTYSCYPAEPARCYVDGSLALYSSISGFSELRYIAKDVYSVASSNTFTIGQVVTIDGAQYVHICRNIFYKIPTP